MPIRDDCKMGIVNAIDALQIAKPDTNPIKVIPFPLEDGNLVQDIINKRTATLQYKVNK